MKNTEKNYVSKHLRIPKGDYEFIKDYIEPRRGSYQVFIEEAIKEKILRIKIEINLNNT